MLLSGGGMLLGWSLGASDAGNVFGTAVGGRIISWRRAALLAAICAIAGAGLQGKAGTETLAGLTAGSGGATAAVFAAATTVIAMTLAKELTDHSLPEIGDAFGGRDHTTVLHACRRIETLRETEKRVDEDYLNLLRTLTG